MRLMEPQILTELGLSADEAEIYLSLIELGPQTAIQIGKNTKVKRTYVYKVIQGLIAKGLASQGKQGKTTIFAPLSPDHLLSLAEAKKQKAEASKQALEDILGQLKAKYVSIADKPVVTTYEGINGLKKVYEDMLKEGKEIFSMLQTSEIEPELREWLKNDFVPRRAKLGVPAKVILASGKLSSEFQSRNPQALRTVLEVPSELFPFPHEVDVYGEKIAFVHFKKGEPLLAILIYHPAMAETMRIWFDLAWRGAKKFQAK